MQLTHSVTCFRMCNMSMWTFSGHFIWDNFKAGTARIWQLNLNRGGHNRKNDYWSTNPCKALFSMAFTSAVPLLSLPPIPCVPLIATWGSVKNECTQQKTILWKFIKHVNFNTEKLENDIAVLKHDAFTFNKYVEPLAMPPPKAGEWILHCGWHPARRFAFAVRATQVPLVTEKWNTNEAFDN